MTANHSRSRWRPASLRRSVLFLVDTELDFSRVAADALAAEQGWLARLRGDGVLLRAWQKINGRGAYLLWDCAAPQEVDARIEAWPGFHYAARIEVLPLLPHRIFGEFAARRAATGRATGALYLVRLEIDRARLGPERPEALVERAERTARRHVDEGTVVGIWRKLHGSGAVIAWQCADNAALHAELSRLPLKGYFAEVGAEPVVPLPGFEDLAGWTGAGPVVAPRR
jgi:muconolactone delta-isomerase